MMIGKCREHIQKIRNDFQASQRVKDSLNNSIKALASDLYSKDTHFIFELIQNAEDNTYEAVKPSLSFRLLKSDPTGTLKSEGALIIENNEIGFSSVNIEAICAVGKSTKSKIRGYIGEKGIGFKSVFRVTSNPHIFSKGYRFCLPEDDEETGLGYIVPQWVELVPDEIDLSYTTIILPLNKAGFGYKYLENMLQDIEPETILFLSKLKKIKIDTNAGDALTILKDDINAPQIQIEVKGTRQGESFSVLDEYLLYNKSFEKPQNVLHEKRINIDKRDCSVAFPLNKDSKSVGKIFAYLPVRSAIGLPFLINADFILPSSREDILENDWNKWLMGCIAELAAFVLPKLKDKRELTIKLLEALAKSMQEIPEKSILYPIVCSISDAFKNENLIPTGDGTFVSGQSAKLASSSELRNLLNQYQLGLLLQSPHVVKWLSSEITQEITPHLRCYLMVQLGVEEIGPKKFVELLTDDFLENQVDRWIIDFYTFFKDKADFWKKPDAPLRKRKIIRLEDNSHVVPFKSDGTPNAYLPSSSTTNFPTIKKSIFEDEAATDFLNRLRIPKSDLFAEIIQFILPKYAEDSVTVDYENNIDDLRKIKILLDNPSQGSSSSALPELKIALEKLGITDLEKLGMTDKGFLQTLLFHSNRPFRLVRASNGLKTDYRYPKDIYKNTPELHCYFQDNHEAWFVCDGYTDELSVLQDKGCDFSLAYFRI